MPCVCVCVCVYVCLCVCAKEHTSFSLTMIKMAKTMTPIEASDGKYFLDDATMLYPMAMAKKTPMAMHVRVNIGCAGTKMVVVSDERETTNMTAMRMHSMLSAMDVKTSRNWK